MNLSPTALLVLGAIVLAAAGVARVATRFRQPPVLGHILLGLALGPTLCGRVAPDLFRLVSASIAELSALVWVGAALVFLTSGMESDVPAPRRDRPDRPAVAAGGAALALVTAGSLLALLAGSSLQAVLAVAAAVCASGQPAAAWVLTRFDLGKTEAAVTAARGGTTANLGAWLLMGAAFTASDGIGFRHALLAGGTAAAALLGGGPLVRAVLAHPTDREVGTITALSFGLGFAALASATGLSPLFGLFAAGLALVRSRRLRQHVRATMGAATGIFLAPLPFVAIGQRIDLLGGIDPALLAGICLLTAVPKLLGATLGAQRAGLSRGEALAIGTTVAVGGGLPSLLAFVATEGGLCGSATLAGVAVADLLSTAALAPVLARGSQPRHRVDLREFQQVAIVNELLGRTPTEVIRELVRQLAAEGMPLDRHVATEAVLSREEKMGTGIGSGVALPHARLTGLERPILAFGRSRTGVPFDAPDNRACHLIFLLLTPSEDEGTQLHILARIARAMSHAENREALQRAESMSDLLVAFERSLA